jgi:PAS domain S-box-containing protein
LGRNWDFVKRKIHLRKLAEESLRQRTEELNQFFNVSPDLFCIANTDGYFLRINPTFERILGYTHDELTERQFLDLVHPDDIEDTRQALARLGSQQKVINFENRYRCKDGTYRWMEWNSVPAGNLIYAAARDITEKKRGEEALEERLRFEELLSNISSRFVNIPPDRVDLEIEESLKQILDFFKVDRCALIRVLPGTGSWQITHLAFSKDTPPESLEQNYIRDLNAAAIYFFKADVLCIDLKYDTGTMKFLRMYFAK